MLVVLAVFAAIGTFSDTQRPNSDRSPNIVLVLADDLGFGEVGVFGQQSIRTPHVDRLAREGVAFDRFYAASTVCAPTRASLMTGKHTGRSAVRGNKEVGGWGIREGEGQMPLPARERTIAEILQTKGYRTGAFGKWGLGGPGTEGHPMAQGFDAFFGYLCQRQAHGHTPPYLWKNHDVYLLPENGAIHPHQRLEQAPSDFDKYMGPMYAPQLILDEALKFVEANKDRPFFLYFPSALPHAALQAPKEWVDRYPREWDPSPYLGDKSYLPTERPRATYAAMISFLDHSLGALVEKVDELGLGRDTLIVFTSDNGATFNGGVDLAFFRSNGKLRGHKTQLYEGGVRVPFVARWAGTVPAGERRQARAAMFDLFATFAEMAGDRAREDGRSLLPTLRRDGSGHESLYFEFPEGNQSQALIWGRYKGVRPNLKQRGLEMEVYDLETDPGETRNLAPDRPDLVKELAARMARAHRPNRDFPLAAVDPPQGSKVSAIARTSS
ncbi:MAG: arylsulfatase [Nitrospirae bacterium]|nr:arylsulfatase [Fimbriimonadaceae bacterium]